MEGPRAVRVEEFDDAVRLINMVFRESGGLAPTIQYEFPTLLNKVNCENMRAMFDNGRPVAVMSFYKTCISILGCRINAACVGAVTTRPDSRRLGLASTLLKDGEDKMRSEGIDLIIISGNNNVYLKQNYSSVVGQTCFSYKNVHSTPADSGVNICDINEDNFAKMVKIYAQEPIRFIRGLDEHRLLYGGALFDWGGRKHKAVLIEKNNRTCGYLIVRTKEGEKTGELVEYGGSRELVFDGLHSLCHSLGLEEINGSIPYGDAQMLEVLADRHVETEETISTHTIKVVNFVSMMRKLKDYFAQLIDRDTLDCLSFDYDGASYIIRLGEETFITQDVKVINSLVFGSGKNDMSTHVETPRLKKFFENALPVNLPYFKGLNFI